MSEMDYELITRGRALLMLNDHLGETVRVSVTVEEESIGHDILEFGGGLERIATEEHVAQMDVDERDFMASAYMIGAHSIHVGYVPGPVAIGPHGLEFQLAPGVVLSVHWLD